MSNVVTRLTVAGAIAGGPVGAAVGALTSAVLRKPLGEMGARSYCVTGPWKDPKGEVMGREAPEAPAQPQAAPPQPEDKEPDAEMHAPVPDDRSEEHTDEIKTIMRI